MTTSAPRPPVSSCTRARDVLLLDVDDVVGAELARQRQLRRVARQPGDDDRCRRPAARAAITLARPRWPGPRISTLSPGPVSGISTAQRKPAPSGLNITAMLAGMSAPDAVHDRVRVEVHVVGVRAPQAGRARERHVAVRRTCRRGRGRPGSGRSGRRGSGRRGSAPRRRRDRRRSRPSAWPRGRRCAR